MEIAAPSMITPVRDGAEARMVSTRGVWVLASAGPSTPCALA